MEKYACWNYFLFSSEYCGSHYERWPSEENEEFLFHPSIDIGQWSDVVFEHTSRSRCYEGEGFFDWLDKLEEGVDYVDVENLHDEGPDLNETLDLSFNEKETALLKGFAGIPFNKAVSSFEVKKAIMKMIKD